MGIATGADVRRVEGRRRSVENAMSSEIRQKSIGLSRHHPTPKPFLTTSMHFWYQDLFSFAGTGVGTTGVRMGIGTMGVAGVGTRGIGTGVGTTGVGVGITGTGTGLGTKSGSRGLLGTCLATRISSRSA